jgi:hypothetical protein
LAFAAVALVLAPAAIVMLATPEVYAETFGAWLLHPAHLRNPVAWAYAATNHNAMRQTAHAFWDFFSPAHLLFADGQPAMAGFFLFATGALAVVGSRDVLRRSSAQTLTSRPWWLILGATLASVFAMALFREERAIDRALTVAPLAVLLSARGARVLSSSRAGRVGLGVATMLAVAQFAIWFWRAL